MNNSKANQLLNEMKNPAKNELVCWSYSLQNINSALVLFHLSYRVIVRAETFEKNQPRLGVFVIEHVVVRKKKCETSERNNKKLLAAILRELKVCGWEKTHRITRTTARAMENLLSTMRRLWQHDRKFNFKWNFQSKSNEECLLVSMAQDDSFRSEAQEWKFGKFQKISPEILSAQKLVKWIVSSLNGMTKGNCGRWEKFYSFAVSSVV